MMKLEPQTWMSRTYTALFLFLMGLLTLSTGCQSPMPSTTASKMTMPEPMEVVLAPGDEIEVKFFYHPDLNEEQTIRPDGKITLQLMGDITATGKTPEELQYVIRKLSELLLDNPEVTVFVRALNNRRIYIGGAVQRSGALPLTGRVTALDAILSAGGFNMRRANAKEVVVIRHKDGQRYGCTIDLNDSLLGAASTPFYLQAGDIVFVPTTPVVQVGQWIDQHINKIIPQFGVVYSDSVGSGTLSIDTARDFTPVF